VSLDTQQEALWTIEETAAVLGVSPSWVRQHPELPRVKLGKSVRFVPAVVRQFIAERMQAKAS
jgi:predicted DNA-binding transcriptional regulator AlpA